MTPALLKNTFLGIKPLESFTPGRFWVKTAATAVNSNRMKKNVKNDSRNLSLERPEA